tara:strand:- start:269 stop:382 length:114 start_codon:yes stop_codon:yes gene_type:complete
MIYDLGLDKLLEGSAFRPATIIIINRVRRRGVFIVQM